MIYYRIFLFHSEIVTLAEVGSLPSPYTPPSFHSISLSLPLHPPPISVQREIQFLNGNFKAQR